MNDIMMALDDHVYSSQWRRGNGRYIPCADKWLKGCWWDELREDEAGDSEYESACYVRQRHGQCRHQPACVDVGACIRRIRRDIIDGRIDRIGDSLTPLSVPA
jgi:hypothetical protein